MIQEPQLPETICTFSDEYVYGCPIIIKSTNDPKTKIYCGENGTQMTVTAGDELLIVDINTKKILKWVCGFEWGEEMGCAPWGVSLGEYCFVGKI